MNFDARYSICTQLFLRWIWEVRDGPEGWTYDLKRDTGLEVRNKYRRRELSQSKGTNLDCEINLHDDEQPLT